MTAQDIIDFWFDEIDPGRWWDHDGALDVQISQRFGSLHAQAARCELYAWRTQLSGRLAEIIVLDQFSRHIHRGSAAAFACDPLALALAQEAISACDVQALAPPKKLFIYLPFTHSESPAIHEVAIRLFAEEGLDSNLQFERKHQAIINRFGRYPHRNVALGRESSAEEIAFLKTPGSSF